MTVCIQEVWLVPAKSRQQVSRDADIFPHEAANLMSHIEKSVENTDYELCSSFAHTDHLSLDSHPTFDFQISESLRCHGGGHDIL